MINNEMAKSTAEKEARDFGLRAGEMYMPSVFQGNKLLRVKAKEVKFLEAWIRLGDWGKALEEQGMGDGEAKAIVERPVNKEFLDDRMKEMAIKRGLTADWFLSELYRVYSGESHKTRDQIDVLKTIGARVSPVATQTNQGQEKITINVSFGAIKEALNREAAIEAEIVRETNGTV